MIRIIDLRNKPPADRAADPGTAESLLVARQSLNPHAIAFITCVNNVAQYDICVRHIDALQVPSGYSVDKIAVFGATSMAEGYQRAMEASTARYKLYVHQDVYVINRGLLPELVNLFGTYPRLGMVGVVGATRLPGSGIWFVKNPLHSYGRYWEYRRQGGLWSLLGPANRRRLHIMRFRSFVGDYLPAVTVDGIFMASQYDVPWTNPLGGFIFYDQVQALEFAKAGLEVGIARQGAIWCLHWGALQELSPERRRHYDIELERRAAAFRQQYKGFIGVPARKLSEQHREAAWRLGFPAGQFTGGGPGRQAAPGDVKSSDATRERLGVVIVTFNGIEVLRRALGALLPQCDALKEVGHRVVVVDDASTDGTVEAVRREFPQVIVIANASNDGPARGFNLGLRQLSFPNYVLVMNNDVEFVPGTLARMVSYLREHPSSAGVIASLTNPDGSAQLQRMATVELMRCRPRRPRPITFVGNTCALVRGDVFFDVGLYDERFHFYNEDLEWSLRAKRKGYSFIFLPKARVIHHQGLGLRQNRGPIFTELFVANLWHLYKHGGPRWAAVLYRAQWVLAKWLAFRWRNDIEALHQLGEAMVRAEDLYRRLRQENRLPQLLVPNQS